ncbi:MAG TPA: hypothetical protein VMF11_05270 [Candidatus Baltobacteraceae bacterium]|nr:hypothetical protein [Candidatus Baltobacteraceae bacterium]
MTIYGNSDRQINRRAWVFAGIVIVVVVIKLWLTSEIRIVSQNGPHDASNFIEHAKSILEGRWFGDYNDLTLIKQPFFPIYLAVVQEFGVPLALANELLYALASFIACIAVRPIIRNPVTLGAVFFVIDFNPFTYGTLAWVAMRSDVNQSLALLSIACAAGIFVRRKAQPRSLLPWLLGLGISFAAFWLTREEAIWLVPGLFTILAAYVWYIKKCKPAEFGARMAGVALPVSIWAASVGAIMLINGLVYGWYTTNEQWAPEFVSAYDAFSRIVPPTVEPYVPVPRAAREIAYRVSPSARELRPFLEGSLGKAWTSNTCFAVHICNDIGGGWFEWALRDAVALAGHYTSGRDARSFYTELANEIDRACDSGEIRCRPKGNPLLAQLTVSQIPGRISDFAYGVWMTATLAPLSLGHEGWSPYLPLLPDYDFVATSVVLGGEPSDFDSGIKWGVLGEIAQAYRRLTPLWIGIVLTVTVLRVARVVLKRSTRVPDYVLLVVSVMMSGGCLLAMLSLLNALAPSGTVMFTAEYMSSLFPLIFFALAVATSVEAAIAHRYICRRFPPLEET